MGGFYWKIRDNIASSLVLKCVIRSFIERRNSMSTESVESSYGSVFLEFGGKVIGVAYLTFGEQ